MGYLLAVDTETDGVDWFDGKRPFIATASDHEHDYLYRFDRPQDVRALGMKMLAADALVYHNAPFDVHMLVAAGVLTLDEILSVPFYDTYVIAKVVLGEGNFTGSHLGSFGLKDLAAHLVNADAHAPEAEMKRLMKDMGLITRADQKNLPDGVYHELWKVRPEVVETYALMDTRITYDLYRVLMDRIDNERDEKRRNGWTKAITIEHAVMPELIRMEHRGILLDRAVVDDLHDEYTRTFEDLRGRLDDVATEAGLESFNPDAAADVVALLEAHGVVITELTDNGQVRTDKATLEKYEHVPVVRTILDYKRTAKFLSTYLGPMKDRDTIHTSFSQIAARTHRMSSRRPNMQNVPVRDEESNRLRRMFVPRPGYCLVTADYDRVEPTLLAWYMKDYELMDSFLSGDPYLAMGTEHYGTADQTQWKLGRHKIKNAFLALTYSVGVDKLAKMLECAKDEAAALKESIEGLLGPAYSNPWYPPAKLPNGKLDWSRGRRYPEFGDGFVQNARKRIWNRGKPVLGYVMTLGGSVHRIEPPDEKAYQAPNTIIQGSAAYIMKVGLIRAADALRPFGGHVLLVVHDDVLAEVPLGTEHDALAALQAALKSAEDLAPDGKLRLATTGAVCYTSWAEAK